jgi:hypothetical protein
MIKASDSVEDLLEKYPSINGFLLQKGIVCVKCGEPFWGKLEDLIQNKGLDVDKTVAELNRFIEE